MGEADGRDTLFSSRHCSCDGIPLRTHAQLLQLSALCSQGAQKEQRANGIWGRGGGGGCAAGRQGQREETKTIDTVGTLLVSCWKARPIGPCSIRGVANQNAYYVAGRPAN